jgi:hypothetical protein
MVIYNIFPIMASPKIPAYEAYKKFIDILVEDALTRGEGTCLKNGGKIMPPSLVDKDANKNTYSNFFESLDDVQKKLLITLLQEARIEAFHDVLAQLTFHIDCHGFGMTFNGQPMPVGIEGGLHQDFIGRLDGGYKWRENPPNR